MKRLLIFILLLFTTSAYAEMQLARTNPYIAGGNYSAACGSCQGAASCTDVALGCSYRETFNGALECATGYTSNCSAGEDWWTVAGNTPDFDNTSYPASGATYAMYLYNTVSVRNTTNLASVAENYAAAHVYIETLGPNVGVLAFKVTTTTACTMDFAVTGVLTVTADGGTVTPTIATLAAGNAYYLLLRYKTGGGANAECEGWVSSDGINWGTSKLSNDGTSTSNANRLYLTVPGTIAKVHYREVRIHTGAITW